MSLEQVDNRIHRARELLKAANDLVARQRDGILKNYIEAKTKLSVRKRGSGPSYHGFTLETVPNLGKRNNVPNVTLEAKDTDAARQDVSAQERAMFSLNVQTMEGKQMWVPSLVRPQTFDDRLIGGREPLYLFQSLVPESGQVGANREVRTFISMVTGAAGQSAGQQVQPATDGVKDDSGFNPHHDWDLIDMREPVDFLARFGVQIDHDAVWPSLSPMTDAICKNWELGYGPIDGSAGI